MREFVNIFKDRSFKAWGFLLSAALLLPLGVSCEKSGIEPEPLEGNGQIVFSVSEARTRAFLNTDSLRTDGSTLVVYDRYTNTPGDTSNYISNERAVFQSTASTESGSYWPFRTVTTAADGTRTIGDENHYYWTDGGKHTFFCWVDPETNLGSHSGNRSANHFFQEQMTPDSTGITYNTNVISYDAATHILSIPQKTIYYNSGHFDYMFSNMITRDRSGVDKGNTDPVPLTMQHLFTAFHIKLVNDSPATFELTHTALQFHNTASATIDYSGEGSSTGTLPKVTYNYGDLVSVQRDNRALAAGDTTNLYYTSLDPTQEMAMIMWPQTEGEVFDSLKLTVGYTATMTTVADIYVHSDQHTGTHTVTFTNVGTGNGAYEQVNPVGHPDYYRYVGNQQGDYAVQTVTETAGSGTYYVDGTYERTDVVNETREVYFKDLYVNTVGDITAWEPGKMYYYTISFVGNYLDYDVAVMRWVDGYGGSVTFN